MLILESQILVLSLGALQKHYNPMDTRCVFGICYFFVATLNVVLANETPLLHHCILTALLVQNLENSTMRMLASDTSKYTRRVMSMLKHIWFVKLLIIKVLCSHLIPGIIYLYNNNTDKLH